jgi:hypothetical protein
VTLRFSDLNPLGRAIIIVVAALTFGVAAVSFATSYGALYAWVRDTGLYSDRLTRLWPLLLDGAFIVAQLAAILAGMDFPPRAGHRGYAARGDGSGWSWRCRCSHSSGGR